MMINICEYKTRKWGYFNPTTGRTIPCQFDTSSDYLDGRVIVSIKHNYGVIDEDGNIILPFIFTSICRKDNGLFLVSHGNIHCHYNIDGLICNEFGEPMPVCLRKFAIAEPYKNGLLMVLCFDSKSGIFFQDKVIQYCDNPYWKIIDSNNHFIYLEDGAKILLDFKGKQLFKDMKGFTLLNDRYVVFEGECWREHGIVDINENIVLKPLYSNISYVEDDRCSLTYAISDNDERIVTYDCSKDVFMVYKGADLLSVPHFVDWCSDFYGTFAIVAKEHKCGLIDSKISICVECKYDILTYGFKDTFIAKTNDTYFLINPYQSDLSNVKYKGIINLGSGYLLVKNDKSKYGVIDYLGNNILPITYSEPIDFIASQCVFVCKQTGYLKEGEKQIKCWFNSNGQVILREIGADVILSKEIIWVDNFSEGYAIATDINGLKGIINEAGEVVVPFKFDANLSGFNNGICTITRSHNYDYKTYIKDLSYINNFGRFVCKSDKGTITINSHFMLVKDFIGELAPAFNGQKWGLIDFNDRVVVPFEYDGIEYLNESFFKPFVIDSNGDEFFTNYYKHYGVIDKSGRVLIDCKYCSVSIKTPGNICADSSIFDFDGRMLIKCGETVKHIKTSLKHVLQFTGGFAPACDNAWGIVNESLNVVIDFKYNDIEMIDSVFAHCRLRDKHYIISALDSSVQIEVPEASEYQVINEHLVACAVQERCSSNCNYGFNYFCGGAVISPNYTSFEILKNNYLLLCKKDFYVSLFGLADPNGKIVIPCKYLKVEPDIDRGFARVEINDNKLSYSEKFIYVDFDGNVVMPSSNSCKPVPSNYTYGGIFSNGYAVVKANKKKPGKKIDDIGLDFDDTIFSDILGIKPKEKEHLWGLVDEDFNEVITCDFDYITPICEKNVIVSKNGKYGVLNINGKIVIPFVYNGLEFLGVTMLKACTEGKWGLINYDNKLIIPNQYLYIGCPSEGLIAVAVQYDTNDKEDDDFYLDRRHCMKSRHNYLWGYIDYSNKIIISPDYKIARPFSDGLAIVRKDDHWCVINTYGQIVIDNLFVDDVTDFINGKSKIKLSDEEKYIEHILLNNGNILVNGYELKIDFSEIRFVGEFHNGLAIVKSNKMQTGFIDTNGKFIIPLSDRDFTDFSDGYASFRSEKFGFQKINTKGEIVIDSLVLPTEFIAAVRINNDLILAENELCYQGVINNEFQEVIPFIHYNLLFKDSNDGEGYFLIKNAERDVFLFYDLQGNKFIPNKEERVFIDQTYQACRSKFSNGLAAVMGENGLWGFVDTNGKEVIPCIYSEVEDFKNRYCAITIYWKKGLIDVSGQVIINLGDYDDFELINDVIIVSHSEFGRSKVYRDKDGYEIDREWLPEKREFNLNGEILIKLYGKYITIPKDYEWCDDSFKNGFLSVQKNGKWGVLNTSLTLVVDCEYDEKITFSDGLAIVKQDGCLLAIKESGEIVLRKTLSILDRINEFSILRGLIQTTEERGGRSIKSNIAVFMYDECGKSLFNGTFISSRISLNYGNNWSEKSFHTTFIVPVHHDYMKFLILCSDNGYHYQKWGLCTRYGNVIFEARFDDIDAVGGGLIAVAKNNGNSKIWGFADFNGNLVIDYQFKEVKAFSHGVARVSNGKWALLASNGQLLTDFAYQRISDYFGDECVATFEYDIKENRITEQGKIHYQYYVETDYREGYYNDVYLSGYDWCSEIHNEICIVEKGKLQGLISKNGTMLLELSDRKNIRLEIVDDEIVFRMWINGQNQYRHIDEFGHIITHNEDQQVVLPYGIYWCSNWIDGNICVVMDGKWGVLNDKLEFILPSNYKYIQNISGGKFLCVSIVNEINKYSIYDSSSMSFSELDFERVEDFEQGYAIVSKCIKETKQPYRDPIREYVYGLINANGELVLDFEFSNIQYKEPEKIDSYSGDDYFDEPYSKQNSLMDALDDCPDAYWNID